MKKYLGLAKKQKHKKRHYSPARDEGNARNAQAGVSVVLQGQDGWANIWGATLAVRRRVGSKCPRLAGSGGAAVALAASKPYIISFSGVFKSNRCSFLSSNCSLISSSSRGARLGS